MFGLYLFCLVFGFGVIVVDLLGLLGSGDDGGDDGGLDDGGVDADSGDGWDEGSGVDGDETVEHGNLDADDDAVVLPDVRRGRWVYRSLNILRSFVYFSLGFGAVGIFGSLTDRPFLVTLLWAAGTGLVVLVLVKFIMRLQNKVLDSSLNDADLLFAQAEVLVTVPAGRLGRIRVKTGGSYHDLYAKGQDPKRTYPVGETVYVVDTTGNDPVIHTEKT